MQLIAAQADADYNTEKVKYGNEQAAALRSGGNYLPLSTFEQKWQTQRNPQVYAAAMGALAGQPVEKWAKGLSDDPNDPNSEYKRALDVVSRASPSANVNAKSGRISMQPQGNQGSQPVAVKTAGGRGGVAARHAIHHARWPDVHPMSESATAWPGQEVLQWPGQEVKAGQGEHGYAAAPPEPTLPGPWAGPVQYGDVAVDSWPLPGEEPPRPPR